MHACCFSLGQMVYQGHNNGRTNMSTRVEIVLGINLTLALQRVDHPIRGALPVIALYTYSANGNIEQRIDLVGARSLRDTLDALIKDIEHDQKLEMERV
jgi:hypothetical protein